MLSRVRSAALMGIDAVVIEVEVDVSMGLPYFDIVGLPDNAVRESKTRVKAAIKNCDIQLPHKRVTVNLAPADLRKDGTAFDLPIALGVLASTGNVPAAALEPYLFAGELALDGAVRPIRGALPFAVAARDAGLRGVVVPAANAAEAAVVEGVEVVPVLRFCEIVDRLTRGEPLQAALPALGTGRAESDFDLDFTDVRGQEHAKRAMEVAAAGGHNALLIGPPGAGKTMLAKRLPTVLPDMSFEEALETTKVYSVAGLVGSRALITERPFRSPHHTISDAGLIGGGPVPRPGEVSLAHNGVLFLDELPEFRKNVLEVLRQPIEDGWVTIARAAMTLTFPCRMMVVAAMNPCPCGHAGDPRSACLCNLPDVARYRARVSGPLLDRIDIHVEVPSLRYRDMSPAREGESSKAIRARVDRARARQVERFARVGGLHCNAQMPLRQIRQQCQPTPEGERLLGAVIDKLGMSARAYDRILKVARTIADIEGAEQVEAPFVSEAIQYRTLDRKIA